MALAQLSKVRLEYFPHGQGPERVVFIHGFQASAPIWRMVQQALPEDRWTVVTSATERLARIRMASAGISVPKKLVTADQVKRGKPDPEPFLAGAALLGLAPAECVVFEDSPSGVVAGRDAGCTVVATTFSHSAESLNAAHYLVRDLTGIRIEISNDEIVIQSTPLPAVATKS